MDRRRHSPLPLGAALGALAAAAALALLAAPAAAQPQREPWPGYDAYVTAALEAWKVPGAGIAIVRNDSVIYARGYGVRELGKPQPVTERTVFAIGSSSKAFTAAAVAMLVDEGKVRWDDPATRHLPGFQMHDPYATRELSVRDLLSHRSGLARGDLLWYGTELDRDEILRRVRFLAPSWSFRSQFGYQNLMYLAAGQVVARTANATWDDFVERRIFQPLGMTASSTTIRALASAPDVASPHAEIDDTVRVIPWRNIDNIAPAGSINSPVVDVAQWVRLQLAKGKYGGKQLISSAAMDEMHKPHTIVPLEGPWKVYNPNSNFLLYGLGWFLSDYRGEKVVQHGGNIDGMSALVGMLPDEKFGVVILTNMNGSPLPTALMNRTFDLHLKAQPRDWSAELRKMVEPLIAQAKEAGAKLEATRVKGTSPSLPLREYAGTYADSLYGEVVVREQGGALRVTRGPSFVGPLEHWHYDTFRATWEARSLGKTMVTFRLNGAGKVDDLLMELGGDRVAFRRRPAMADTTPAVRIAESELPRYLGRFQSQAPPIAVTVERLGERLQLNVPGQPAYTLVPVTPTRFRLTAPDMPAGFFLVYEMDGKAVKSVKLEQPAPRPTLTFAPAR